MSSQRIDARVVALGVCTAATIVASASCRRSDGTQPSNSGCGRPAAESSSSPGASSSATADRYADARRRMVEDQIARRDVSDRRVLDVMMRVPRHQFMPEDTWEEAYGDHPVGIGMAQTISQPYIVAKMTELAQVTPSSKVLEIGTGSGYQAAVLAELAAEVYTIEILAPLAESARVTLARLGYKNVHVRHGDGYLGWPEVAPFDVIVVTAAPPSIPEPLRKQLAIGGRLVIPVGNEDQELKVVTRTSTGYSETSVLPVRFVPMTGEAQRR